MLGLASASATLHPKEDAIGRAVRLSLIPRGQGDGNFDDVDMALRWMLQIPDGIATKNGVMKGFSTAIAVDRAKDEGVVVLTALDEFSASALASGALRDVDRVRAGDVRKAVVTSLPLGGRPPTSTSADAWRSSGYHPPIGLDECTPGEVVRDTFPLVVPGDHDKPAFTLHVGFYDGVARLPIVPTHGDGRDREKLVTIPVAD